MDYITHVSHLGRARNGFKSQEAVDPQHSVREVPRVVRVCLHSVASQPVCCAADSAEINPNLAGRRPSGLSSRLVSRADEASSSEARF